jgi:hypothetical protein
MASNAQPIYNDRLVLEPNRWYERVLKYTDGLPVRGGQSIMYTTMQNEKFFLSLEDSNRLQHLGLAPNEAFRIMKKVDGRNSDYLIVKAEQPARRPIETSPAVSDAIEDAETRELRAKLNASIARSRRPADNLTSDSRPTTPHTSTEPTTTNQTEPPTHGNRTIAGQMAASYIAAIDALLIARDYAYSKELDFRPEDFLQQCAHSIFIEYGKAQERAARYGGAR